MDVLKSSQASNVPMVNPPVLKAPVPISEEDEETGLLFYDPTEELRAKREAQMIEDQKNKANLLKDGSANNAAVQ